MAQKPVEMILLRQLAATLATPVFLVDAQGTLVFYNEAAEKVLGVRFEETGEMPATDWTTQWEPTEHGGRPITPDEVPLARALVTQRPASGRLWIRGADGLRRYIEVAAFPVVRVGDELLGAVAIFWEAAT